MIALILRIISLIFILIAVALAAVGYAYRGRYGRLAQDEWGRSVAESLPFVDGWMQAIKDLYNNSVLYEQGDMLSISSQGLFHVLGAPAAALVVLAVLLNIIAVVVKKFAAKKAAEKGETEEDAADLPDVSELYKNDEEEEEDAGRAVDADGTESFDPSASKRSHHAADHDPIQLGKPKKANDFTVDKNLLDDSNTDDQMLYDIVRMVALTQSTVSEQQIKIIINTLWPAYEPYMKDFSEETKTRIVRQVLNHQVLRLKRAEKDISSDQFVIQDRRMQEAERETICRRFIPHDVDTLNPEARKIIGNVYTINQQSSLQQSTLSTAEDWHDISLRNLVSVMEIDPHADNN